MASQQHCKPLDLSSDRSGRTVAVTTTSSPRHTETTATQPNVQMSTASSASHPDEVEDSARVKADKIGCAHGTRVYKVRLYQDTLMKIAQKLADVAQISLCMEMSGEQTSENLQFDSVLHKCGTEFVDIGTFLQDKAKEITDARSKFPQKKKKVVKPQQTEEKKHKHYEIPVAVPVELEIVIDEEVSIIPRPESDEDTNTYHDPKRRKPMWTKEEAPSCSCNEEDEAPGEQQDILNYPMGPVKSGRKTIKVKCERIVCL